MHLSSDRQTTSGGSSREYGSGARWSGTTSADGATLTPLRGWVLLSVLVVLLVAGCGGDTGTKSINTESLTSEDLPGLLPDADTAGSVLGATIDRVDKRSDLSQSFEHTDMEDLTGAHVGFYRVAGESDGQNIPTGSSHIALALYETAEAAESAMGIITGELEQSLEDESDHYEFEPTEFDVTGLADAGRGVVFPPTMTILRWDTLVVEIVAFHEPSGDLIEEVRGLAEEISTNLPTIENG